MTRAAIGPSTAAAIRSGIIESPPWRVWPDLAVVFQVGWREQLPSGGGDPAGTAEAVLEGLAVLVARPEGIVRCPIGAGRGYPSPGAPGDTADRLPEAVRREAVAAVFTTRTSVRRQPGKRNDDGHDELFAIDVHRVRASLTRADLPARVGDGIGDRDAIRMIETVPAGRIALSRAELWYHPPSPRPAGHWRFGCRSTPEPRHSPRTGHP